MKKVFGFAFLLALASTSFGQTRAAIQAQYDRFAKAYVKHDVKTMLAILSPSYKLTNEEGEVISYAEYKADLLARKKAKKKSQGYTVKIASLSLKGDTATARTRETTLSAGKPHVHLYRDVWLRTGKTWRLVSTRTLGHGE